MVVGHRLLPGHFTGLGVERDDHRLLTRHVDLVAPQGHAAVGIVQRAEVVRQLALVAPDHVAGLGVEGKHLGTGVATNITPLLTMGGA